MPKIYFEELLPRLDAPKPTPSRYAVPQWWKNMPKFFDFDETFDRSYGKIAGIKKCPAVEDAFFAGYTLYLPADIYIDATENEIKYRHPNFLFQENSAEEMKFATTQQIDATKGYESVFDFHEQSMKWQTYWGVRTDKGYSTLFTHPMNRTDLPFFMIDAIVDTDKYTTRFPYSFFIKNGFKGTIKRGTPILQALPFKREDVWESEIVSVDAAAYAREKTLLSSVFEHGYKKFFWTRKKFI